MKQSKQNIKEQIDKCTVTEHHLSMRKRMGQVNFGLIDHLIVFSGPLIPLAVFIQAYNIWVLDKGHKFYTRIFGVNDQIIHSLIILPFWIVFVVLASQIHASQLLRYEFIDLWIVGVFLVTAAVVLFVAAIKIIGSGSLINSNFFKPQNTINGGVYRYFKNPIYGSYAILFLGIGLIYGNWGYIVLSALVWLLLICIESKVEKV